MVDKDLTGRELGTISFPGDRSKIREFARALDTPDPIHLDVDVARAAGFSDIPAPLTFVVSSAHWRDEDNMVATLGMDLRRVLHGECGWEYLGPVVAGDELTATRRVAGVTTREGRRGGAMTMVSIETDFTNQRGELVVRQTDVLVETGG